MSKFSYSPGLPGYGTKGVDGSSGLNGLAMYFTNYDGIGNDIEINVRIINNQVLWSDSTDQLQGYPQRVYQDGDLMVDKNSSVYEIKPEGVNLGIAGITYYIATGYILNAGGYLTATGMVNSTNFERVTNTITDTTKRYLIDNVYPSSNVTNYTTTPYTIYGIQPIEFGQIKFCDTLVNNYNPFVLYTAGSSDEKSMAIIRDANNKFRMGNLDYSLALRDVGLAFDFADILFNVPNLYFEKTSDTLIKYNDDVLTITGSAQTVPAKNISIVGQSIDVLASNMLGALSTNGGNIYISGGNNNSNIPSSTDNIVLGGNVIISGGDAISTEGGVTNHGGDVFLFGGTYSFSNVGQGGGGSVPDNPDAPIFGGGETVIDNNTIYAPANGVLSILESGAGNIYIGYKDDYRELGKTIMGPASYVRYTSGSTITDYKVLSRYDIYPTNIMDSNFIPNPGEAYWHWELENQNVVVYWNKVAFFKNSGNYSNVQANLVLYHNHNYNIIDYKSTSNSFKSSSDVSIFSPIIIPNLGIDGSVTFRNLPYDACINAYIEFVERTSSDTTNNGWTRRSEDLVMRAAGTGANIKIYYANCTSTTTGTFHTLFYTTGTNTLLKEQVKVLTSCSTTLLNPDNVYIPFAANYDVSIYVSTSTNTYGSTRETLSVGQLQSTLKIFSESLESNGTSLTVMKQTTEDLSIPSGCCPTQLQTNNKYLSLTFPAPIGTYQDVSTSINVSNRTTCLYQAPQGKLYYDVSIYFTNLNLYPSATYEGNLILTIRDTANAISVPLYNGSITQAINVSIPGTTANSHYTNFTGTVPSVNFEIDSSLYSTDAGYNASPRKVAKINLNIIVKLRSDSSSNIIFGLSQASTIQYKMTIPGTT